jgi:hypothetical protein
VCRRQILAVLSALVVASLWAGTDRLIAASSRSSDIPTSGVIAGDVSDFTLLGQNGTGYSMGNASLGDLAVGDFGSPSWCTVGRRAVIRFALPDLGTTTTFQTATLTLTIAQTRRDNAFSVSPPFENPGLGDVRVVHIADQRERTTTAYETPSIGGDPGTLIPSTLQPGATVSIDVTTALRQEASRRAPFVSFRLEATTETDADCRDDVWFFVSADRADAAPSIAYATMAAPAEPPTTPAQTVVKPVFGALAAVPSRPVAGKRLVLTLAVNRSDTGGPLTTGRMICDPSVAGALLKHTESFVNGKARLSLVVPKAAKGKPLRIKVKITSGSQSATKLVTYKPI